MAERNEAERGEIEDRAAPRARIVHEVVRKQGEEELAPPAGSLFWSSVAAGITITASVIAQGALHHKLPAGMESRTLVSQLGYPLAWPTHRSGRSCEQGWTGSAGPAALRQAADFLRPLRLISRPDRFARKGES